MYLAYAVVMLDHRVAGSGMGGCTTASTFVLDIGIEIDLGVCKDGNTARLGLNTLQYQENAR